MENNKKQKNKIYFNLFSSNNLQNKDMLFFLLASFIILNSNAKMEYKIAFLSQGAKIRTKDKTNTTFWSIAQNPNAEFDDIQDIAGNMVFGRSNDYAKPTKTKSKIKMLSSLLISIGSRKKHTSLGILINLGIQQQKTTELLLRARTTIKLKSPYLMFGPLGTIHCKKYSFNLSIGAAFQRKTFSIRPMIENDLPKMDNAPPNYLEEKNNAINASKSKYYLKSKMRNSFSPSIFLSIERKFFKKTYIHINSIVFFPKKTTLYPINQSAKLIFENRKIITSLYAVGVGLLYKNM